MKAYRFSENEVNCQMQNIKMLNAGEQGLVIEFGQAIDEKINVKVAKLTKLINETKLEGIIEVVPTYRSLLVYFEPLILSRKTLIDKVNTMLSEVDNLTTQQKGRIVHIPVCYVKNDFAPDIDFVAKHNNLDVEEVINLHTKPDYLVYMLGFMAGFPYLGGMSEKIITPRLATPRTKIPAGSVGIADRQTGIYPVESPGGWQLIGRTPVLVYNPQLDNPFLFKAGDYLRFESITEREYELIEKSVLQGSYKPVYSFLGGEQDA